MKRIISNERGVASLEFILALPPFLLLLIGAVQLGMLALARTGLQHAVDEAARYATIYPTPTDQQIIDRVNAREFGLDPAYTSAPVVTNGTEYDVSYTEITMSYSRPLNFIFFQTPAITVSYTRRAY